MFLPMLWSAVNFVETFRFSMIFAAIFLATRLVFTGKRRVRLPPGPRGIPVFGNIFQLGKNPHLTMTELARKYGDVYTLRLGSRNVIVVNGMDAIRQALLRQSMDFVSRPEMYSTRYVCNGHSIAFGSMPVDEHRRYRKLIVDALSTYALCKAKNCSDENNNAPTQRSDLAVERIASEEVSDLAKRLIEISRAKYGCKPAATDSSSESDSSTSVVVESSRRRGSYGTPIDASNDTDMVEMFNEIAWTTSSILCAFLFGERHAPGNSDIDFIIDNNNDFSRVQANSSAADMMPWSRYLIPGLLNKFIANSMKFHNFMQRKIQKHLGKFDKVYDWENHLTKPIEPKNVLDGLILTARKNKDNPLYTEEHTLNTIIDLMGAGFDTVSKCLTWIFVYASVFTDAQEKIQQEVDDFVRANKRKPSYADRKHFHYTNAFIHEVLRHSSFIPFTIPHAVSRDNVRLRGYDMPRGTIVFVNQWSVNHDETVWKSPNHFRPERFLATDDGSFKQEDGDKVLIFGMGRRICPGKTLAKLEMFLYVTEILHKCDLSMHPDHPGLPATEYGLTMRPETGRMIVNAR